MKTVKMLSLLLALLLGTGFTSKIHAQETTEVFSRAKVVSIIEEGVTEIGGYQNPYQKLQVKLLSGPEKGKVINLVHGGIYAITNDQKVTEGQLVVINSLTAEGQITYWLIDKYRLQPIIVISVIFFLLVIFISGLKGIGSIVGMLLSLIVIVRFIVPQILQGSDPLTVSLLGSLFILFTTMYFAHGYNNQTTIAVVSTFIALFVTGALSILLVSLAHLTGLGTEEAYSLQLGQTSNINLKGLLLGGIIIGALGVLDDITTTQVAAIFQIHSVNPKIKLSQLITKGMNIGKEHVSSLVNTLLMAYAGASLPLFILFVLNPSNQPYWAIINSEIVSEEIIRTISGSFGLILAVPLSTYLASWYVTRHGFKQTVHPGHHHH